MLHIPVVFSTRSSSELRLVADESPTPWSTRLRRAFVRSSPILFAFMIFVTAGTGLAAASQADQPEPLTLAEALRIFRTHSFDLLIADAAVESARADETIAGAIANPSLSVTRGNSSGYDPTLCSGCSNRSLGLSVTDPTALSDTLTGKRRLRLAVARAAVNASRQGRADVERTLEFTLKEQLLQAELARQSLTHASDSQRLTTATLDLVNRRYHAGAVSEADVARAEVQKLEADQAVDLAKQAVDSTQAGLAYFLGGSPADPTIEVGDDLIRAAGSSRTAEFSRQSLLDSALSHRPDLQAAISQIERAQASIRLAQRLRLPDVSPTVQYSAEGHGQNAIQPPTLTFGVSLSPPLLYRYRGELAKAEADLRTQSAAREKIHAQIVSDVSTSWSSYSSARARIARMQGDLIVRAARARDLVKLQYEKGAASLFELLDAQRTYVGTQTELLQNINDYWTAVFLLEQATGLELRQ